MIGRDCRDEFCIKKEQSEDCLLVVFSLGAFCCFKISSIKSLIVLACLLPTGLYSEHQPAMTTITIHQKKSQPGFSKA